MPRSIWLITPTTSHGCAPGSRAAARAKLKRSDNIFKQKRKACGMTFTPEQMDAVFEDAKAEAKQQEGPKTNGRGENPLPFILFDQIELVTKQWLVRDFLGVGEAS